jgi:hypothetical protein
MAKSQGGLDSSNAPWPRVLLQNVKFNIQNKLIEIQNSLESTGYQNEKKIDTRHFGKWNAQVFCWPCKDIVFIFIIEYSSLRDFRSIFYMGIFLKR